MSNMKRRRVIRWGSICMIVAAAVLPAIGADEGPTNAVQMVTYFPVPYAQYNNLYPTEKLDIGTAQSKFELLCGGESTTCPTTNSAAFTATHVNLRSASGKTPTLKISQDFRTETASFGDTSTTNAPTLQFHDLYLYQTENVTFSTIQASSFKMEELNKLTVWGKQLPPCQNVQWVVLVFGGTPKNYLVCCDSGTTSSICGKDS